MSTQKCRSGKAKSKTASSAATELIPPEIRELLGPSPVVDIAEEPIFERMLAGAVSELGPSGMIEWTLVFDFVVTTWEIRQLREYKTSVFRISNVEYSSYEDPEIKRINEYALSEKEHYGLRTSDLNDLSAREALRIFIERLERFNVHHFVDKKILKERKLENISTNETPYNRALRLSLVILKSAQTMENLQKMTLMLEKRRDSLLRDLDRRQAARRERDAAHPRHDRTATDIETRVEG